MRILADRKLPEKVKSKLARHGDLIGVFSEDIVYDAISGHPDIFFCKAGQTLIAAPNLPENLQNFLKDSGLNYTAGKTPLGKSYPDSAAYNAVVTDRFLIHRLDITDQSILQAAGGMEKIHVPQGYCRCSLIPIKNDQFITSDRGIFDILSSKKLIINYLPPDSILLKGFDHGFLGGTCGIDGNRIFFTGSLNNYIKGKELAVILEKAGYEIIELSDGPLIDCGSIMFI
jgi:hypothetical protein